MTQPSIFDRLRSMQTEGLPLHTLIVEACEVGNELIVVLQNARLQLEYLDEKFPATGTTAAVLSRINVAIDHAHRSNGDTPTNGARAA